jgi:ferric-dicitrate binding protein FerR (iron transport regulator)
MKIDEHQFRKLLDAYINGTATPAQKQLLNDFFESYPEAEQRVSQQDESIQHELWMKLSGKLEEPKQSRRYTLSPWYSVAAALALFVATFYFLVYKKQDDVVKPEAIAIRQQTIHTDRGQKLKIDLIDGTQVILNANSIFTFPEQFTSTTREVYLEGEAYFEVAHDTSKPFIVHTASANTTVLGTSFNIRTSPDKITEITLVEGKVNVGSRLHTAQVKDVILEPHQQAIVTNGNEAISKKKVNVQAYVDWKDNVLHFENITLAEAVEQLESWYKVDITFQNPALANCIINATYKQETLPNILKSIEYMLKITCTQKGNSVIMQGKGCDIKPKQKNI